MDIEQLQKTLQSLIGRRLTHGGAAYIIIEVLEKGPQLVLQCDAGDAAIQADQFGGATRRVPRTITVPVVDTDGIHFHPDFLALQVDDATNLP